MEPVQKRTLETAGKGLNGNPCPKMPRKHNQRLSIIMGKF